MDVRLQDPPIYFPATKLLLNVLVTLLTTKPFVLISEQSSNWRVIQTIDDTVSVDTPPTPDTSLLVFFFFEQSFYTKFSFI